MENENDFGETKVWIFGGGFKMKSEGFDSIINQKRGLLKA